MSISIIFYYFVIIYITYKFFTSSVVPPDTAIIVDRNSHYYKTYRSGTRYWLKSSTDMITTYISTKPVVQTYGNNFATHDSKGFRVAVRVTYKAVDSIDDVLDALKKSRRSIYDIVNTAVETVVNTCSSKDMNDKSKLCELIRQKIEYTLEPFNIEFLDLALLDASLSRNGMNSLFQRHISRSEGSDQTFEYHNTKSIADNLISGSSNNNDSSDPLDYKNEHKKNGVEYL